MVSGPEGIAVAAEALRSGRLVALPTETVYGLAADATDPEAVAAIFRVKGRPTDHPLIVHIADATELDRWASSVSPEARALADAFWPGPLTLLLTRSEAVGDWVTGGRDTVGLRVPGHPVALALLEAFGGAVAAPSANRFGKVSPTTAAHVVADLGGDVEVVLDGGACTVGVESTIVDCSGDEVLVLRQGGVSVEALRAVLGFGPRIETASASPGEARAPGMLAAHYAPSAQVIICASDQVVAEAMVLSAEDDPGVVIGVLAPGVVEGLPVGVIELEPAGDAERYASVLYDRLRQADRLGITHLLCVPPPAVGVGAAVLDRLQRASVR
ncbi:MAG: threonylcarbamoyl-AMP synthase [Acidobacteria bacterium]|nr:threonylcarbamoyl-AMP synthase [Acidobacteriota bacterium]